MSYNPLYKLRPCRCHDHYWRRDVAEDNVCVGRHADTGFDAFETILQAKSERCGRGARCDDQSCCKSHSFEEMCWYNPLYKTKKCGTQRCTRSARECLFAHEGETVREWKTEDDYVGKNVKMLFPERTHQALADALEAVRTSASSLSLFSAMATSSMKYRFLGDSGLLVSVFGFGCMMQSDADVDGAYEILAHGFKHGINFWDTAEGYGAGASERGVGAVIQRGIDNSVWTREDLVISTKIYIGTKVPLDPSKAGEIIAPNAQGLSRKHLIEGTKASLARLQLDYVDVLFAHRPDKFTPIEEVVRGMNFIINQGWAFYWGTSEWQEQDILTACEIADRLGMIRPIVEQTRYHLFDRSKVEVDFQSLYKKYKLGLTTFSPLAYGLLTGKYANGTPEGSRLANEFYRKFFSNLLGDLDDVIPVIEKLRPIADKLGCSLAQLAVAWCASNPNVSTVLLGAKTVAQLDETLQALPFVAHITPEIKREIDAIIPFHYKPATRDFLYSVREKYL